MTQPRETNLALFIDFDNLAIGARDARQRLDIRLLIQRILEKGKIIVKRAYADWHHHKEHMTALHESAIDLIEVPAPRISGKNSADIRMVVDAMDLCYAKEHIDTFVICSGDSDFSPLVSKLRENNKRVIGVGMKNSSSHLLIGNCDEFIFYDDIYRQNQVHAPVSGANVPLDKREMFDFLVQTVQSLLQEESRGVLFSSLIKDTMTRKQPHFSERALGYGTFGDVLEEARNLGLLQVERDARSGGTWVVRGLGAGTTAEAAASGALPALPATVAAAAAPVSATAPAPAAGGRSSRRRRRSGRGGSSARAGGEGNAAENAAPTGEAAAAPAKPAQGRAAQGKPAHDKAAHDKPSHEKPSQPRAASAKPPIGNAAAGNAAAKPSRRRTATPKADPGSEIRFEGKPTGKPASRRAEPAPTTTTAAPATKKVVRKKAPTAGATPTTSAVKKATGATRKKTSG
jgi:uncharacterized protein (TIGR00288 family)